MARPRKHDTQHFSFHAFGGYLSLQKFPSLLDLFYVGKYDTDNQYSGESGSGDLLVNTVGVHGKKKTESLILEGTLAGQIGDFGHDKIRAIGTHCGVTWSPTLSLNPSLAAHYTVGSGDTDPDDGTYGTFDGLFGSAAKYYGRMNMFFWSNLQDIQLDVTVRPLRKLQILLSYHYLLLTSETDGWYGTNGKIQKHTDNTPWRDSAANHGRELGQEIDIVVHSSIIPFTKIQAGYGHFFPGDFVVGNAKTSDEKGGSNLMFFQAQFAY